MTKEEVARHRLVERITLGSTTPAIRALAAAAIEVYEARGEGPVVWAEIKHRLIEAAMNFGKATERDGK
jgi:hypothetical protein